MGDEALSNKVIPYKLSSLRLLSVEPAGFLIVSSAIVSHLTYQNLLLEAACRYDLGYPEETCNEIIKNVNITFKTEEHEIQKVIADVQAITSIIFGVITVLVVLFVGSWSDDSKSRKLPLIISACGIISFAELILLCYFLMGNNFAISAMMLSFLVEGPNTLTGSGAVFSMSAYSYIADTTSAKSRTLKTGVLTAFVRFGIPCGFGVGAGLGRVGVGTVFSLCVAMGLGVSAVVILLVTVKTKSGEGETRRVRRSDACIRYNPLRTLYVALSILWKKRIGHSKFILLVVAYLSYLAPENGEFSIRYLFMRERLQWNVSDYGFFFMVDCLISAAGVFVSMLILSKMLRISDSIVGIIASLSQIAGSIMYAFAISAAGMYMASSIDLMNGTIGVVLQSMLSKTVVPEEIGKLFALTGVLESLVPIAMVPAFAMLYKGTLTIYAGAIFFLSAALTLPALVIFTYFYCTVRDESPKREEIPLGMKRNETEFVNQKLTDIDIGTELSA